MPGKKKKHASSLIYILIGIVLLVVFARRIREPLTHPSVPEPEKLETAYPLRFADTVYSLGYSSNGILAAGKTDEVVLLDALSGKRVGAIALENSGSVGSVNFSSDGKLMGIGCHRGAFVYEPGKDEPLKRLHGGFDNRAAASPDGKTAASANRRGIVWLWDAETGGQKAAMEPEKTDFTSVLKFTANGSHVVSGHFDARIHYWESAGASLVRTIDLMQTTDAAAFPGRPHITDLAVSPCGGILACIGYPHTGIFLFDLASGRHIDAPGLEEGHAFCVDFSPDGNFLALGARGGLQLLNTNDWAAAHFLACSPDDGGKDAGHVKIARFSPDGGTIAAVCLDNSIRMFEAPSY